MFLVDFSQLLMKKSFSDIYFEGRNDGRSLDGNA